MSDAKQNILILGSGGREHALAWKLGLSKNVDQIYVATGNGGTSQNIALDLLDFPAIEAFCKSANVQLVVVGPELPLTEGIVDYFEDSDIKVFGPKKRAAQLEGSKIYAKHFMRRYEVQTAEFWAFDQIEQARERVKLLEGKLVIKYDGLAAGKGVYVCKSEEQAFQALNELEDKYGSSLPFLIERLLPGVELSIIGFTDGQNIRLLSPSQDHKQLLEADQGPNTGGMGAFCPLPFLDKDHIDEIHRDIINPTMLGLIQEKMDYKGVLYFGIMMTQEGPKLLEYNVRLGDPETEVILPALKSDLYELIDHCLKQTLSQFEIEFNEGYFIDVVLVSQGYPLSYQKGFPIEIAQDLDPDCLLFHAGTISEHGQVKTNGGRVLNLVCQADDLAQAIKKVYREVEKIQFENKSFRTDIGCRNNALPIKS